MRSIKISHFAEGLICLSIVMNRRATRFYMSENEAQHLSNRLQAFAKGTFGSETILTENAL